MLTKVLGIDIEALLMAMLALVGLYLVLTHAGAINGLVRTLARAWVNETVVLQGRRVRPVLGRAA